MITVVNSGGKPQVSGSKSLRSSVKEYLIDQFRNGSIDIGECVPQIQKIADTLKISTNVVFLALKDMRSEGWLEQASNRRCVVAKSTKRLLLNKHLRIDFSSCGIEHIRHSIYQVIFNYLVIAANDMNSEIRCILELMRNFTKDAQGISDVIVVADWQPVNFRSLTNGPVIGLDKWDGIETDYTVSTDHFLGGEIIARHLWERGRRKVVYWNLIPEWADTMKAMGLRQLGFLKGWIEAGGSLSAVKVLPVISSDMELNSLVEEYLEGTDTFFCCTDAFALKMWDVLKNRGIKVPDDIAIAGFDGSYEAVTHEPILTTVKQPCENIVKKIMDLINNIVIKRENICEKEILVPPELILGGST